MIQNWSWYGISVQSLGADRAFRSHCLIFKTLLGFPLANRVNYVHRNLVTFVAAKDCKLILLRSIKKSFCALPTAKTLSNLEKKYKHTNTKKNTQNQFQNSIKVNTLRTTLTPNQLYTNRCPRGLWFIHVRVFATNLRPRTPAWRMVLLRDCDERV